MKKLRFNFVRYFDRIFKDHFCWADCVSWAFNYRVKNWNPLDIEEAKTCREESEGSDSGTCYCGRFYRGIAVSELTEQQLEAARNDDLSVSEITAIKTSQTMRSEFQEKVITTCFFIFMVIVGLLAVEALFVQSINF